MENVGGLQTIRQREMLLADNRFMEYCAQRNKVDVITNNGLLCDHNGVF